MRVPITTQLSIVDLYMAHGRLRAEIPMQGYSRLSDLFNNGASEFVAASVRMTSATHEAGAFSIERRDLVVRIRDVRLVRPIEERGAVLSPGARRERLPARVVVYMDDWQVTGDVHLVDRIPWLDFLDAMRNRFVSVSNASVRFVGVAETLECEYLLINGARVSALYEAT